jgi:hypothetical protein
MADTVGVSTGVPCGVADGVAVAAEVVVAEPDAVGAELETSEMATDAVAAAVAVGSGVVLVTG